MYTGKDNFYHKLKIYFGIFYLLSGFQRDLHQLPQKKNPTDEDINTYFDKLITAFRIIPDSQNKSGIQINIRMMRYDTVIIRTICAFSG